MTFNFDAVRVAIPDLDPEAFEKGSIVVNQLTFFGTEYDFIFRWNGKHGRYLLQIVRDDDEVVKHYYPKADTWRFIPGFNPDVTAARDAAVRIVDTQLRGRAPTPERMGDEHFMTVMVGRRLQDG